ncbi:MAG: hypothetical protein SGJ13_11650 [Actinomycetota bacterium]|nr:hypothetical protein [Actinomycetota bacterium]
MAIERLPEHLKTGRTAEAVMAPSAILAGGVGASAAVLLGAGLLPVALVGAAAYGVMVALRLPRRKRPLQGIDPMALSDPWRRYVHEALQAKRRFDNVVRGARTGPVHDRLAEIGTRIESAVKECWRVASHGDLLDAGLRSLDLDEVRTRREQMEGTRPESPGAADSWDRTAEALEAQLSSGERLHTVASDARQRLEVLDARLDEAVARAVELSLSAGDVSELSGLGADVDQLVGDMEALRQGLEEVGRAAGGSPR